MARLLPGFTSDPITRGWAVVTSAGVVRLGLGFLASLLIARALGPADFGIYAVLAASVALIGGIAEGGLTEAAVLRISSVWTANREAAFERGRTFFWLRVLVAALLVSVAWLLAGGMAADVLKIDENLLRWALVGIVATAASGGVSAILQSIGGFGRMSALTIVNTGLTAVLAVVLTLWARLDILAALIVLGIGTSVVTFAIGRRLLPTGFRLTPPPALSVARREGRHLIRTGRWLWLASMFAMLTANAEILLLNQFVALPLVGAYAVALSLASRADVVNHSLYTVLLPSVATLRTPDALKLFVRRGLGRSAVIGVALLLSIPVAEPAIVLVYGAAYSGAATLFQLLIGVVVFDVMLTPLLLLPLAHRQPKVLAAADATRAVMLVGVGLATIPVYGAAGAILARFVARVAGAVVVLAALWSGGAALEVQHEEPAGVA